MTARATTTVYEQITPDHLPLRLAFGDRHYVINETKRGGLIMVKDPERDGGPAAT